MKIKTIIYIIAIIVIFTTVKLNLNFSSQNNNLSNVSLLNIEALAQEITDADCDNICQYSDTSHCWLYLTDNPSVNRICYYSRLR
jgi:hypothetical protein